MIKIFKKEQRTELGRTMMEMLATLVIVGVVVIGSIWGYRFALDVIMANSIVTGVRARSIIIGQQRVLEIPLNLQEFIEDDQAKDLIFDRFEVKAYNDYKNAIDASKYQGKAVINCGIDDGIQVLEVFDVPYRVCEHLKKLEFTDPTCNAINGEVYREGTFRDEEVPCIEDVPPENPSEGGIVVGLEGEFRNVLTFVFDDGVGMKCSKGMDCPTGCCEEGVCVRLEEGKQCYCDKCEESDGEGGCKPKAKGQTCIYPSQAPCCCDGEGNIVNCPLEPPSSSGGVEDSTNPDGSSSSSGGGGDPTDPDNPDNPDNSDEESCDENKDPCCGFEVYPVYNCGMPGPQKAWYCCNPKKDPHECHFDCHNSWYPLTDDYYGLVCCLD